MRKLKQKKLYLFSLVVIGILIVFISTDNVTFGEPGSQEDPLVTLSYVQKRIDQLKFYVDQKVQEISDTINGNKDEIQNLTVKSTQLEEKVESISVSNGSTAASLEVVELRNGQKLICKAGAEIILRGGKAKAIASELGGLSDVTGAVDIKMNQDIPSNHLLIVPRDDGRGVYVEEYAIFMIRGEYEIK